MDLAVWWLLSRVFVFGAALLVGTTGWPHHVSQHGLALLTGWDGKWYREIASSGPPRGAAMALVLQLNGHPGAIEARHYPLNWMILAWPLLLVLAALLAWQRRGQAGGRGWVWFLTWAAAGYLMSVSLITGFSVGLLFLPLAALALLNVAMRAPHAREASGFLAGVAITVLLVIALNA
jgi:hypothetical protein